jgi:hypothetical protein
MGVTSGTGNFGSHHAKTKIFLGDDVILINGFEETWPAGARMIFMA